MVLNTTRGCRSTEREDPGWVVISYTYFISKEVILGNLAPLWIACNKWTVGMGGVFRRGRIERLWAKPIVPVWLKMEDACISFFWDGDGKSLKKENNQDRNWSTFWQFCTFKWCWNSDIKKVWLICANNWMPQLLKLSALLMCAWDTKANYKRRGTKTCSSCGHRVSTYAS